MGGGTGTGTGTTVGSDVSENCPIGLTPYLEYLILCLLALFTCMHAIHQLFYLPTYYLTHSLLDGDGRLALSTSTSLSTLYYAHLPLLKCFH